MAAAFLVVAVVLVAVFFAGAAALAGAFLAVELEAAAFDGFGRGASFLAPEMTFFRSWPA